MSKAMLPRYAVLSLLVLLISVAGCKAGGSADGGSSPEDVASKIQAAAMNKDYAGFIGCVIPEDRPALTMMMAMFGTMGDMMPPGAADDSAKKLSEDSMKIMEKYKVEKFDMAAMMTSMQDEETMKKNARATYGQVDHKGFVGEMMALLEKSGNKSGSQIFEDFVGEVGTIEKNGDTAKGKIGKEDVGFKKLDGRWYIVAE